MNTEKDVITWKAMSLHVAIIVGVFTVIGFMGDRFFLTRNEGDKIAAKLSDISVIVQEIQLDMKARASIIVQQGALIERVTTALDALERRTPVK